MTLSESFSCSADVIKCPAASNSSYFNSNCPKNGFSKRLLINSGPVSRTTGWVLEIAGERRRTGERAALLCQLLSPRARVRPWIRVTSAATRVLVDRSHIPVERHLQCGTVSAVWGHQQEAGLYGICPATSRPQKTHKVLASKNSSHWPTAGSLSSSVNQSVFGSLAKLTKSNESNPNLRLKS